jgi:hypothetical protein
MNFDDYKYNVDKNDYVKRNETKDNGAMTEREKLFEWLSTCPVAFEQNFDDYEILSINFLYVEEEAEEEDEQSTSG